MIKISPKIHMFDKFMTVLKRNILLVSFCILENLMAYLKTLIKATNKQNFENFLGNIMWDLLLCRILSVVFQRYSYSIKSNLD